MAADRVLKKDNDAEYSIFDQARQDGPLQIQELEDEVSPALAAIFSTLITGVYRWTGGRPTPSICNKGPKGDPGIYKPVSPTSVCYKLMDSVIRDTMLEHLLKLASH